MRCTSDLHLSREPGSECWMFNAVQTAKVIFTAKISLEVFSLREEQVWTFSVLGDRIYDMRCLFVAVPGLNVLFIVLPHWDNMSYNIEPGMEGL